MIARDGGPAFPSDGPADAVSYWGMSLRDYFAGQALVGWLGSRALVDVLQATAITPQAATESMVSDCYQIADAMIAERAK